MGKLHSRREFLVVSSVGALVAGMATGGLESARPSTAGAFRGTLCLFSKPVPQLSWRELARSAKQAGFQGIDLTVRQGGHVQPARAAEDLPKAVAAIRAEGLEVPMVTSELVSAEDPAAVPILRAMQEVSIPFLKPGYYHYKFRDVRKEVAAAGQKFRSLVAVAGTHGVQVGFHSHSGYIGGLIWDFAPEMDKIDPKWAGYYYDLENVSEEGGVEGWRSAANLAMPRMKMLAVKDFYWKKKGKGWQPTTCPLGEGMCHHNEFLKMAAEGGFHGPVSLHIEYQIPGVSDDQGIALARANAETVMAAAQRDLNTLKSLIREAYGE